MIGVGHFGAAKVLGDLPNARVVRGDDDFGESFGLLAAFDDVLDEGFAGDKSQRFSRKAG